MTSSTDLRRARCRAHPEREAAANCRGCHQPWCRECVTEHASVIYCRQCLPRHMKASHAKRGGPLLGLLRNLAAAAAGWLLLVALAASTLAAVNSTSLRSIFGSFHAR